MKGTTKYALGIVAPKNSGNYIKYNYLDALWRDRSPEVAQCHGICGMCAASPLRAALAPLMSQRRDLDHPPLEAEFRRRKIEAEKVRRVHDAMTLSALLVHQV